MLLFSFTSPLLFSVTYLLSMIDNGKLIRFVLLLPSENFLLSWVNPLVSYTVIFIYYPLLMLGSDIYYVLSYNCCSYFFSFRYLFFISNEFASILALTFFILSSFCFIISIKTFFFSFIYIYFVFIYCLTLSIRSLFSRGINPFGPGSNYFSLFCFSILLPPANLCYFTNLPSIDTSRL